MSATWFITGASRGIGLELVRQLLQSAENVVIASCRSPAKASALHALADSGSGALHVVQLDATDEETIKAAAAEVDVLLGSKGLDYLINNAGVSPGDDSPLTLTPAVFLETFTTNTLGPLLVLQHFVRLVERSARPVVVNVSSALGGIGEGIPGPFSYTSYSVSKAGLNMLNHKFAREKPNIISIVIEPGWTKTDMGGPHALLEPKESVAGVLSVLASIKPEDSGTFKKYDGGMCHW